MNEYTKPEVVLVGKASETILGIVAFGYDLDGMTYPGDLDFAEDAEESGPRP